MHALKEGATILQHHPTNLPPPIIARIKDEPSFYFSHSNHPIDNAAAAAAAAAAGLIDPHHNRELHNALVASINNNVAAVNGTLTTAAVLKSQTQQQQQQATQQTNTGATQAAQTNNSTQQQNAIVTQQQQQSTQQQTQQTPVQQAALALMNGTANGTSTALVVAKTSSSGRSTPNNSINGVAALDSAPGKLFVGGLSWQTSSEKLKEYFNMFGTVTDVLIMKDPVTQRSRGFGFITFQEANSVEKVLQVPIHTLDGKKIDPKHATPKNRPRQANKTKKIFVGGVSQDTSADEVKAYFGQFGAVEETVMLMDQQTKRHRGFGFVTFENEDIVDRVCEIHFHTIKNKKVECKKAQPKEAVTPAAQLLQKRIMLGTLGVPIPTAPGQLIGARTAAGVTPLNHLAMLQTPTQLQLHAGNAAAGLAQQAALISQNPFQVQNAAAAAAVSANPASFGKLLTTYPQAALHSVRYTPYTIPATAAAANALAQAQQQHSHAAVAAAAAAAAHHQPQTHTAAAQSVANANPGVSVSQAHNAAAYNVATNTSAAHGAGPTAHSLAAAAAAQQAALVASNPLGAAAAAANPYQSYALANVDMSSFQGVDWSSMYGMGMYV